MQTTNPTDLLERLYDPVNRADPYPVLHRLRERSPFPFAGGLGVVVGSHAECSRLLHDPRMSADRITHGADVISRRPVVPSFLSMDPPDHTRLRRLVVKAFSRQALSGLEPRIRQIAAELAAELGPESRFDVVSQFAYPLPVRVISELLAIPASDRQQIQHWSDLLTQVALDPPPVRHHPDPGMKSAIQATLGEFTRYFEDLIRQRRRTPGTDLLSRLVLAGEQGNQLSEEELVSTCILLLTAGYETTAILIANAVLALLRHPEQLDAVRKSPGKAAAAVEETLRYDPPVQLTNRFAREPMRVGEVELPAGGELSFLLAAANRDPAVFPEPDRFDIDRGADNHLAFSAGPHFCLGAGLARLEGTIALQTLAPRLSDAQLEEDVLDYKPNITLRGPARLEVSLAPSAA
ncbi:cytochrome P450 [Streptomyces sp. BPTC-684]|uniref:cytochrome P450 n=1 Tax=Streptomyces sp. BPTC-684 TaxID=3043734 RepID=UPI0024B19951|nr:cytochrome P450 [Streptomyces sp. BPTC-684]WHM41084.1 cytochrome P450 [Streptomyces sp. BPTC-684]